MLVGQRRGRRRAEGKEGAEHRCRGRSGAEPTPARPSPARQRPEQRPGSMRLRSGVFAAACLLMQALGVALFLRGFFPVPVRSVPRREVRGNPPAEPAPPGAGNPSSPDRRGRPFLLRPSTMRQPCPAPPASRSPGRGCPWWPRPRKPLRLEPGWVRDGPAEPRPDWASSVCRGRFVSRVLTCETAETGAAYASSVS